MNEQKQKLLAVLDMSEDEQWDFIISYPKTQGMCDNQLDAYCTTRYRRKTFADLAFRLRDEAVKINQWRYSEIMRDICRKVNIPKADNCSCFDAAMWAEIEGKPIHWIIAALIAKESK